MSAGRTAHCWGGACKHEHITIALAMVCCNPGRQRKSERRMDCFSEVGVALKSTPNHAGAVHEDRGDLR